MINVAIANLDDRAYLSCQQMEVKVT